MPEEIQESLSRPEEGPRYKILVFQMNPHAQPHLKIAEGLFGKLDGRGLKIRDFSHLEVSGLPAPTAKVMPDVQEREKKADWFLKPERFFREPLEAYSAIVISGSPFMAYPQETAEGRQYLTYWKREMYRYIRAAVEHKIPIFGICYGAQILAEALGGKTQKMRTKDGREVWEWGWSLVKRAPRSVGDPIMEGLPAEFVVAQNRHDCISRLPEGAVLLAENEYGVQGFRVDDEKGKPIAWGFQFHPERPAKEVNKLLNPEKYPKHLQKLKEAGLDPDRIAEVGKGYSAEQMRLIFSNFLNFVRSRL